MAGFLDKVVVGINKGVNSVSEGSKLIVERANINTQIKETEKQKNILLQNMGALVYNLQVSGEIEIPHCTGMCSEITTLDQNILALQKQLQALETSKTPAPATYTQTIAPAEAIPNGITCECGFINKEGAKFCAKCGKPM